MLRKLWNGDYPLWFNFWILGIIVSSALRFLFNHAYQSVTHSPTPSGMYLLYLFLAVCLTYLLFIWIVIWKSATKYKKSLFWAYGAKIVVVLSVLNTFINSDNGLLTQLFYSNNKHGHLQELNDHATRRNAPHSYTYIER